MIATSLITQVDKYKPTLKVKVGNKTEERIPYFCHAGDTLEVLTYNAGSWCGVVICMNNRGERYNMRWDNLFGFDSDFTYDINFELE